jgi:phosphatidylserine/phosphatidylglycerophosphate/cardiolipin synthase-like enzyme
MQRPLEELDRAAGLGIDTLVRAHHRRRLRRAGRGAQLDPPGDGIWAGGDPLPREGCRLEILIDGAEALPRISEALDHARTEINIAAWAITPDFGLDRDEGARRLRDHLAELAERVDARVLLWAGAPMPVFSPRRSQVRRIRDELTQGSRVQCALDSRERPMHCHHEKLVIVDGKVAFVGGIDLTSLGGDRFDSADHPARGKIGWHDASSRLEGPAVADVADHFAARWHEVTGERLASTPPPPRVGDHEVQVIRTVPEKSYAFLPQGDFRILESYQRALRSARSLIYLENQFLWAPQVVEILLNKLRDPPTQRFRVLVVLPAKPNNGADDTRGQLAQLAEADDGAGRFLAATLQSRTGQLSGPLYVHAKIGIVDDSWLTIGSANLNEHSFFNDTEMNVACRDPARARETRLRLWSEHLERPVEAVDKDPAQVIDELWKPLAREQLERRERGEPATHRLLELRGVSRRSAALLGPLQGFVGSGASSSTASAIEGSARPETWNVAGDRITALATDRSHRSSSSTSRASTLSAMPSRSVRTSSIGRPLGSGKSQSTWRVSGMNGQLSPHPIVTTTSAQRASSSVSSRGTRSARSMPSSDMTSTTCGCTSSPGVVPAERAPWRPSAARSNSA